MTRSNTTYALAVAALTVPFALTQHVLAAGTHGHGDAAGIGAPGKPSAISRTITVTMHDNYFEPADLEIKEGETVKFIIKNEGTLVHEFNIGTAELHEAHAPDMQMMFDHGVLESDRVNWDVAKKMQKEMGHGMHDEPKTVLLEPGRSAEMIWQFPDHAEIEFACNIPGHYDAGMAGEVKLTH